MKSQGLKKLKIPDKPGVYFFLGRPKGGKKGKDTLYIGKATSLRSRVRSYFGKDLIATRGPTIVDMVFKSSSIKWQETDSVLEALILEAELIKKHQPKYNTKEKDNKSFMCVVITDEAMPQVLTIRTHNLKRRSNILTNIRISKMYGPFTNGLQLREAMKIIRRIFPYIDAQSSKRDNFEFYRQLGLTPDTGNQEVKLAYKKNIANLKLFFQGKKKKIITNLKKEMLTYAKAREFEKAGEIKKRIFALEHINDIALIKEDVTTLERYTSSSFRIEAYDIAHMSGKNMVGVMVVVESGQVNKAEYKKFIIRTQSGSNDTGALEEVLSRRLRHTEWGLPSLIAVDGSTAQQNVAKRVLKRYQFDIPIVAVVKDDKHKARAVIGDEALIKTHKKSILLANSEAHRFAIAFHKQKRSKNFLK